jgi:hypothetical protein
MAKQHAAYRKTGMRGRCSLLSVGHGKHPLCIHGKAPIHTIQCNPSNLDASHAEGSKGNAQRNNIIDNPPNQVIVKNAMPSPPFKPKKYLEDFEDFIVK